MTATQRPRPPRLAGYHRASLILIRARGGVHALLVEDAELIGHASVVQRRLLQGGRLYASRGWQLWRGPSSALTPEGIRRTADKDGWIYVLPVSVPVDVSGELVCDWRPGSVW